MRARDTGRGGEERKKAVEFMIGVMSRNKGISASLRSVFKIQNTLQRYALCELVCVHACVRVRVRM